MASVGYTTMAMVPAAPHGSEAGSYSEEQTNDSCESQGKTFLLNGPVQSRGSVGHPSECNPCSFYCYSYRGCVRGADCSFCHMEHVKRCRRHRAKHGKRGGGGGNLPEIPDDSEWTTPPSSSLGTHNSPSPQEQHQWMLPQAEFTTPKAFGGKLKVRGSSSNGTPPTSSTEACDETNGSNRGSDSDEYTSSDAPSTRASPYFFHPSLAMPATPPGIVVAPGVLPANAPFLPGAAQAMVGPQANWSAQETPAAQLILRMLSMYEDLLHTENPSAQGIPALSPSPMPMLMPTDNMVAAPVYGSPVPSLQTLAGLSVPAQVEVAPMGGGVVSSSYVPGAALLRSAEMQHPQYKLKYTLAENQ